MIRHFRNTALQRFYLQGDGRKLHAEHRSKIADILARLDAAASPSDMDLPGFRLHPLKGDYDGLWAVTVRANWRIVFRFDHGDAVDVDYIDYH